MRQTPMLLTTFVALVVARPLGAEVGDPQIRTDHPWYPGELGCSTFARLFATQAELYQRVTGRPVTSEEDKVLASWLWRNTPFWHGEEGGHDFWGRGPRGLRNRSPGPDPRHVLLD